MVLKGIIQLQLLCKVTNKYIQQVTPETQYVTGCLTGD